MATPEDKPLSARQLRAIEALLTHDTLGAACVAAGLPERTVRRWRKEQRFRLALEQAGREAWTLAVLKLQRLAADAVKALQRNVNACATLPNPRLAAIETRAAAVLLAHLRDSELQELASRVAALESRGSEA